MPTPLLQQLAARLRAEAAALSQKSVVSGFDGFVDEMINVVETRQSLESFTPVPTIERLGELIGASARQSSLREIVINAVHPGGCAVNSGDALGALGVRMDVYATMGVPRLPAFDELAKKCRSCTSWGEVGRTLAFEFSDGKLMFSNMQTLARFDEDTVRAGLADGAFARHCEQASVILLTDWSLYPHMTKCWRLLREKVFSNLSNKKPYFIDLVDPGSRSDADVREMLEELSQLENCGPVHLGLNGSEVRRLCRALDIPFDPEEDSPEGLGALADKIRMRTKLSRIIVHRYAFALCVADDGLNIAEAPFCKSPKKSTGAGDRFNAGFITGLLLNEPIENCLRLGNACSGFFVRNARSATTPELATFLENWASGSLCG